MFVSSHLMSGEEIPFDLNNADDVDVDEIIMGRIVLYHIMTDDGCVVLLSLKTAWTNGINGWKRMLMVMMMNTKRRR